MKRKRIEYIPQFNYILDFFYGVKLSLFSRKKVLTEEDLITIQDIEAKAYPDNMTIHFNRIHLKEFLDDSCCSNLYQIDFILGNGYYLLCANHYNCVEILDFASKTRKCTDFFRVISFLKSNYAQKYIFMKARESTTYPIIKAYEKRGKIIIYNDHLKEQWDERWHFIRLKFK